MAAVVVDSQDSVNVVVVVADKLLCSFVVEEDLGAEVVVGPVGLEALAVVVEKIVQVEEHRE